MLTRLFEGSVDRQSVLLALALTVVVAWIAALLVQRLAGAGLHALGRDRLAESATHFHGPVRLLGSGTFLLVFGVLLFPAFQIVGLHPRTGIDLRSLAEWMFDRGLHVLLIVILAFLSASFGAFLTNAWISHKNLGEVTVKPCATCPNCVCKPLLGGPRCGCPQ